MIEVLVWFVPGLVLDDNLELLRPFVWMLGGAMAPRPENKDCYCLEVMTDCYFATLYVMIPTYNPITGF